MSSHMLTAEAVRGRLRIIAKPDAESRIGRGAYLLREHFSPDLAGLVHAVAEATEELLPDASILRITEGWRPQRDPASRDLHSSLEALDFTIEFPNGRRASVSEYRAVAERARATVGDELFDFAVHGKASGIHIHAERDPH